MNPEQIDEIDRGDATINALIDIVREKFPKLFRQKFTLHYNRIKKSRGEEN